MAATKTSLLAEAPIAYHLTIHHKFPQFLWLFEAIYNSSDVLVIHVDRKSSAHFQAEVQSLIRGLSNVLLLRPKTILCGGWSQVAAEQDGDRDPPRLASGLDISTSVARTTL